MEINNINAVDARKTSETNCKIFYDQARIAIDGLIKTATESGKFSISYSIPRISSKYLSELRIYYQSKAFDVSITVMNKSIRIGW